MTSSLRLLIAAAAAACVAVVSSGLAMASTEVFHGMRVHGATTASSTNNLAYQGGPVEVTPAVYIDYWGSQWATGFSTGGYTSAKAQLYTQDFFSNVGGSGWDNINTQYCSGVATGTVNCGSAGTHVTNPNAQLKGVYTHNVALPSRISQSAIAAEAVWAMNNVFGGYNPNATYFVYTPSGHSMSGFGSRWCAWHSVAGSGGNAVAYAYMPYQPDAGTSCGENFINSNDSYGHGYFDGFSVVGGHEYAEAITDPHPASGTYAWVDASGSEIGDKCAWSAASANITLGSNYYAVQPLWSNASSGCAISFP